MLDIAPSCNPVQYQKKLVMQTWKNGEKPNFRSPKFFSWVLPLLVVSHVSTLGVIQKYVRCAVGGEGEGP